ncbi:MAG: hypothetical protein AB7I04_15650 [Pseudomonadales bacterium]
MDRFELNWPNMDAQLLTDGWRCRIVWRQRGRNHANGIGGTIDNNLQCVRRLAESLDGAPYLLGALRSRGHDRLARQIETAADAEAPMHGEPVRAEPRRVERRAPTRAPAVPPTTVWLKALEGSDVWEAATGRRAKAWIEIGRLGEEALFLKAPAPKGKPEWVIKRTWPEAPKRKAEYVAAAGFKGIARWLLGNGADEAFIEQLLGAASALDHEALEAAAGAWRRVQSKTTH